MFGHSVAGKSPTEDVWKTFICVGETHDLLGLICCTAPGEGKYLRTPKQGPGSFQFGEWYLEPELVDAAIKDLEFADFVLAELDGPDVDSIQENLRLLKFLRDGEFIRYVCGTVEQIVDGKPAGRVIFNDEQDCVTPDIFQTSQTAQAGPSNGPKWDDILRSGPCNEAKPDRVGKIALMQVKSKASESGEYIIVAEAEGGFFAVGMEPRESELRLWTNKGVNILRLRDCDEDVEDFCHRLNDKVFSVRTNLSMESEQRLANTLSMVAAAYKEKTGHEVDFDGIHS